MAKNSFVARLKRWQAMDDELASGALYVRTFAQQWEVSEKTVRRDLADLRAMGQRIGKKFEWELAEQRCQYEPGVERLFVKKSDGSGFCSG